MRATLALALALLAAACTPGGPQLEGGRAIPGGAPVTPEHTLSAGDEFEIRLPFATEYNDRVTVAMDGTVAPQAIGSVAVGGLTVPEATERLKQRYAKLLKAPELSITMRRYEPEIVYVDGWVRHPGLIRSELPLTAARAITRAGGVKSGAQTSDVLIMRHDADGTVHTFSAVLGNYAGAGAQDPLLKSFDVVYVPQTALAAASEFAQQYLRSTPFSASFQVAPQRAPTIVTPQVLGPAPAPAPVVPR